jgi:GrpB-like predicted nucleotidyltransferase (UPF0157 family)
VSQEFTAEAEQICAALGSELRRIEHVGPTAVPGLSATHVVDIALSVESLDRLDAAALEELGYRHHGDWHFSKLGYELHAYQQDDEEFLDLVRFRDYLRTHDEDRDAYGALTSQVLKDAFAARLVEMLRRG